MAEWVSKPLGQLLSYIAKGIPPKYTETENENTVSVLNQKCNRNFVIKYDNSRLHDCTKKKVAEEKMLQSGDVLINSTGTGTAGRVAQILDIPRPTTIDGHMILIRPTLELDPVYFGYAVKSFQSVIETLAEGSTGQTEINRKRLQEEIIITYPKNKKMQKIIADFLLEIDKKIITNDKINRNFAFMAA
jgi:type I restriction enzyme S subunit